VTGSNDRKVDPGKQRVVEIISVLGRELQSNNFTDRKGATFWRRTNIKFDIVKVDVITGARSQKWHVPSGSFSLQPSCLFLFLPQLGRKSTENTIKPEMGFGHLRLSLNRNIPQAIIKATNVWWPSHEDIELGRVVTDVLHKLNHKVLPFFSRFEDTEELLRTFLEDDDAIGREGVWDFGKKGSPKRLLYMGFAAIECEKWKVAVSSLQACREETIKKTIMAPEGLREQVRAEILPYVDQGLACAEERRRWSTG